jgi:dTDP-glucose 4,6-dehydratase|tara:strand:- start:1793 stop:2731 length:939 start_codon:yes stop_codon:yes gene_type:complete
MRVVVAGGAGFLGSHLTDALIARGDEVVCLDNYSTGRPSNVAHLVDNAAFTLVEGDVVASCDVDGPVDAVMNLASPASPKDYFALPIETLDVGSIGTRNLLELAHRNDAKFFMASTSEVYGDPLVHPQPETYWGHVNSIGERSMYDEAKRFSEALTMAYHRSKDVDVKIVRIFNTYGPRMQVDDGRVVSNFIVQALRGEPMTIYGDGNQTRSFCYVADEIRGFLALLDSDQVGPINIGNPNEFTMLELAEIIVELTDSAGSLVYESLPSDDPKQRQPDITLAKQHLGWEPTIQLREGLEKTIPYFAEQLARG